MRHDDKWKWIEQRGKYKNSSQINEFLDSGFFTFFITNSVMEFYNEKQVRKPPSPLHFNSISDLVKVCASASDTEKLPKIQTWFQLSSSWFPQPTEVPVGKKWPPRSLPSQDPFRPRVPELPVSMALTQLQCGLFQTGNWRIPQSTDLG